MKSEKNNPFEDLVNGDLREDITDINEHPIESDPMVSEEADDIHGDDDIPIEPEKEEIPEFNVEIEGNPIYVIASKWQKEGKLPEDFEVTEDITEEEFDKVLYEYKEKLIENDIESKVLDRLMQEEGLTPEAIQSARLFHFGVQQEDYSRLQVYNALSNLKLDPDSESFDKEFRDFGLAYYIDKGFTEEQASRYVKRDAEEDDLTPFIAEYENHFKHAFSKQKQEVEKTAELGRLKEISDREENLKFINNTLNTRTVDGVTYSKDQMEYVKKAMFEKTELIKDSEGRSRLVTLEQKKILEAKENRDKKLKHRIDFILGIDYKSVVEDATKRAKSSLTKDLKNMVKVTPKKEETPKSKGTNIYEFEREL